MSRDYKKEYREYHSKPEQKKNRAKRNKANRNSDCGPGQEVDHKVPLSKGGSNSPSNWRVVSKETNRKKGAKKMSSLDRLKLSIHNKTAGAAESVDPAEVEKLKAQIAIIKSSQGGEGESLSNAAADAYAKALTDMGYGVDMIDLKDVPYVDDWDDDFREAQKARLAKSQATVLATPVYNWGPSARLNAYIQNAVKAGQDPYRPYSVVAAAGSPRSQGYLHSLQNTLAMEDKGINVGAPIMATEDDVIWKGETPTGLEKSYLSRIQENARVLGDLAQDRLDAREEKTAAIEGVERLPSGAIRYRGEVFPGFNKPKAAPKGSKHKKRVLAKKGDKVKVVNFGARGYKHNYSAKAKKSYLARSAGIKGKDDKFSANYWSRRELWPKNQKADGSAKKKTASWGKVLGRGALGLGAAGTAGALTGAMGDKGAVAGAKNTLKTMAGDALYGAGWAGTLGAAALTLASRGKITPKSFAMNAAIGGGVGAGLGASVGASVGALRSHGQNIWGASPNQKKTASANDIFDTSDLELFMLSAKK